MTVISSNVNDLHNLELLYRYRLDYRYRLINYSSVPVFDYNRVSHSVWLNDSLCGQLKKSLLVKTNGHVIGLK